MSIRRGALHRSRGGRPRKAPAPEVRNLPGGGTLEAQAEPDGWTIRLRSSAANSAGLQAAMADLERLFTD